MNLHTIWKSICVLIVAMLAVMAFMRGPEAQWLIVGAFGLWTAFIFIMLIKSLLTKGAAGLASMLLKVTKDGKDSKYNDVSQLVIENKQLKISLMNQIILRITENLRSCYPDAGWKWAEKNPVERILNQEPCRIKVTDVKDFNFADIQIGDKGELHFEFGMIVTLDEIKSRASDDKAKTDCDNADTDNEWFHTEGNQILSNIACELNIAGYTQFYISKEGKISVYEEGKPQNLDTEFQMPDISLTQLRDLLKTIDLDSKIDGERLAVSV